MGNRGTMVNGKVGFNHAGFQKEVAELPVTLMDRRARLEHEANLAYRGIKSPECILKELDNPPEPGTTEEYNNYWMLQEMAGLVTRWVKVNNVMIWPNDKGGCFVSYYNTVSNHQTLATTSKYWGEALAKAVKEYKEYWKDTYLEPYHYYAIANMINFYCEDATPKKQSPQQEPEPEHKPQLCARLKPMNEEDWIIRYEPVTTTSRLVTKEYKKVYDGEEVITEVSTVVYDTTPSGPIYKARTKPVTNENWIVEEFVVNEDGTETIIKHYQMEDKYLKDWRQGFMRRRKKYAKKNRKNNKQSVKNQQYLPIDKDEDISDDDANKVLETLTPHQDQSYIEYETSSNHDVFLKNASYEQLKQKKLDAKDENVIILRNELLRQCALRGVDPIFWNAYVDTVMKDNIGNIDEYIKALEMQGRIEVDEITGKKKIVPKKTQN